MDIEAETEVEVETEMAMETELEMAMETEPEMALKTEPQTELETETEREPGNKYSALHPWYKSVVRRKTGQGVDDTLEWNPELVII